MEQNIKYDDEGGTRTHEDCSTSRNPIRREVSPETSAITTRPPHPCSFQHGLATSYKYSVFDKTEKRPETHYCNVAESWRERESLCPTEERSELVLSTSKMIQVDNNTVSDIVCVIKNDA